MTRKKELLLFLMILLILIFSGQLLLKSEWSIEQDVLYLKNGTTIIADETSEGVQLIYYQQNDTNHFVTKEDVEYLGKGDIQAKRTGKDIMMQYIKEKSEKISLFLNIDRVDFTFIKERFPNGLKWVFLLFVPGAGYLAVRILKRRSSPKDVISDGLRIEDAASEIRKINFEDLSDMEKIVNFFLGLFKLQIGAPANAISDLLPADIRTFGANKVYQLRVKHNGEWASRRMTIGPLGEETGSKSKCYYVIYDVHMVIKVPPVPIQDFNIYIESIRKEIHIVSKLSPRECITPRVSVIMQRVYSYTRKDLPQDALEQRYIKLLGKRPELQEYLKVGNTFVFFMDLSKYFFLGHIINNLHDMDQKVHEEIMQNPKIIWDHQEFGGRYGHKNGDICLQIQNLFAEYESEIKQNKPTIAGKSSVLQYQIKEWFLTCLAGNKINSNNKDLTNKTAKEINAFIENILNQHGETVKQYRTIVSNYVQSVSFSHNKAQIESITINTLDLLAWLRKKKIAMRDMKPDNLIVAGDTENYPKFLTSADQFTIGLIDVETAVDYETTTNNAIPQPQLGGTPNYATPTHLFPNESLHTVFDDLPRILHLQDWQAVTAIIYKVATGETLFKKTGKLMPAIIARMKESKAKNEPIQKIITDAGKIFWPSAMAEFNAKIQKNKNILDLMSVTISDEILDMIKAEAITSSNCFANAVASDIESQTLFQNTKKRQQLKTAPRKAITNLIMKWKKEQEASHCDETQRRIAFLQGLEQTKQQQELFDEMQQRLSHSPMVLSLSELLEFMFNITRCTMFKTDLQTPPEAFDANAPENEDDHEYEKTI